MACGCTPFRLGARHASSAGGMEDEEEGRPRSRQIQRLKTIFLMLEHYIKPSDEPSIPDERLKNEILHILNESPRCLDIGSVVNDNNWPILTVLVHMGLTDLAHFVIKKYSINVNHMRGRCSPPLNVAVKYGHTDMVEMLVAAGANPWVKSFMCYPRQCDAGPRSVNHVSGDAILLAMKQDFGPIFEILLRKHPGRKKIKRLYNSAIWTGAVECFKILLQKYPSVVCMSSKSKSSTILQTAFTSGCKDLCLALIEHIRRNVPEIWLENSHVLLHTLYSNRSEKESIPDLTRALFAAGLPRSAHRPISSKDGYTALHALCARINTGGCGSVGDECIKVAMDNGADIWPLTHQRKNVLHVLLSARYFHRGIGPESVLTYVTGINKCLEVLLTSRYVEDALKTADCNGRQPFVYVFDTMIRLTGQQWVVVGPSFIETCRLLARAGAQLDVDQKDQRLSLALHPVNHVVATLSGWINWNTSVRNSSTTERIINLVVDLLQMLMDEKAISPQPFLALVYKQVIIMANMDDVELDFVHLAQIPLLFIKYGANPNDCPAFTHEEDVHISAAADFIFYASRTVLLQCRRHRRDVCELLDPLRTTLYQHWLNRLCRRMIQTINTEMNVYDTDCDMGAVLRQYLLSPRPLKGLCRLAVYKSLDWNLKLCSFLPLPTLLVAYLQMNDVIRAGPRHSGCAWRTPGEISAPEGLLVTAHL